MHWRLTKLGWGVVGGVLLAATLFATLLLLPGAAPWTATGELLIAVRAVPFSGATTTQFGIGFDDITLQTDDGRAIATHLLSKRALLTLDRPDLGQLLRVPVPTGTYVGISFQLKSPELRNDWQGDVAPRAVTLPYSRIAIPASFTIEKDRATAVILGLETLQAMRSVDDRQVYTPSLHIEIREGFVVTQDGTAPMHIEGGTIVSSAMYGMDESGTMRQNYRAATTPPSESTTPKDDYASEHSVLEEVITEEYLPDTVATTTPDEGSSTPPDANEPLLDTL